MEPFVLGVDLDDVVGDYVESFRRVVATQMNIEPSTLGPVTTWRYSESNWPIVDRDHYVQLHTRGVSEHGLFLDMPFIDGAPDRLWQLSDEGAWVRIVTHRVFANWAHNDSVAHTVAWLDNGPSGYTLPPGRKTAIPYRDLCFISNKPQVGANLYVEDSPENVEKLRASGAEVIIFTRAHNAELPGLRADNWDEVYEIVHERLEAHEKGAGA